MKIKKNLLSYFFFFTTTSFAAPNETPNWSPVEIMRQEKIKEVSMLENQPQSNNFQITQQDLEKNIYLTENLINQSLISKQWDLLDDLLLVYKTMHNANNNLYYYAEGALLRSKNRHPLALKYYQEILNNNPNLPYVRFDYMAMLFENKQFKQAYDESKKLTELPIPIRFHKLIREYQRAIDEYQRWYFDSSIQYEKINNVNNAPKKREVQLGNRTFLRDEKTLPQSASGLQYSVFLRKVQNLAGNNFITSNIGINGIYYWDNKKYNEERIKFQIGYQYQDIIRSFRVLPTAELEWYSGKYYQRKYGTLMQYSQWLSSTLQINASLARYWHYYVDKSYANFYNGPENQATLILTWVPTTKMALYTGLDGSRKYARDQEESYFRKGIQFGLSYEWQENIGASIDGRYGTKTFGKTHFLFPIIRKDKERQLSFRVWSPQIQWQGIMPKLSYQWLHINSNISDLYQRRNNQILLELEKRF